MIEPQTWQRDQLVSEFPKKYNFVGYYMSNKSTVLIFHQVQTHKKVHSAKKWTTNLVNGYNNLHADPDFDVDANNDADLLYLILMLMLIWWCF